MNSSGAAVEQRLRRKLRYFLGGKQNFFITVEVIKPPFSGSRKVTFFPLPATGRTYFIQSKPNTFPYTGVEQKLAPFHQLGRSDKRHRDREKVAFCSSGSYISQSVLAVSTQGVNAVASTLQESGTDSCSTASCIPGTGAGIEGGGAE